MAPVINTKVLELNRGSETDTVGDSVVSVAAAGIVEGGIL